MITIVGLSGAMDGRRILETNSPKKNPLERVENSPPTLLEWFMNQKAKDSRGVTVGIREMKFSLSNTFLYVL
jgi:hypothetical protein